MVDSWYVQGTEMPAGQYNEPDWKPFAEGEVQPHDNAQLEYIAMLLRESCPQIRVHDVDESGKHYEKDNRRLVQFYVNTTRSHKPKVIVSITVGQRFLDGEEASGWTRWQVRDVEIKIIERGGYKRAGSEITLYLGRHHPRQNVSLSPLMERDVGGLLYFHE